MPTSSLNLPFACRPKTYHNVLTFAICFLPFSLAAPIRGSSTPSTWLACLVTLLVFSMVCLLAFKLLFVHHRRTNDLKGPTSVSRGNRGIYRSSGLLKPPLVRTREDDMNRKIGFLVGLFGSPSFEIRHKRRKPTLFRPNTPRSSFGPSFFACAITTPDGRKSDLLPCPRYFSDVEDPRKQTRPRRRGFSTFFSGSNELSLVSLAGTAARPGSPVCKKIHLSSGDMSSPKTLPLSDGHHENATIRLVEFHKKAYGPSLLYDDYYPVGSPQVTPLLGPPAAHLKPMASSPFLSLPGGNQTLNQDSNISLSSMMFGHPRPSAFSTPVKCRRQTPRKVSLSPTLSVIDEVCQYSLPELPFLSTADLTLPFPPIGIESSDLTFTSETLTPVHEIHDRKKEISGVLPVRSGSISPISPSPPCLPMSTNPSTNTINSWENLHPLEERVAQSSCLGLGLPSLELSPVFSRKLSEGYEPGNDLFGDQRSVLSFLRGFTEETGV